MKTVKFYCLCLLFLLMTKPVLSHELSTAYIKLFAANEFVEGELLLALTDVQILVNMDINNNSQVTWEELKNSRDKLQEFVAQNLVLGRQNISNEHLSRCDIEFAPDIHLTQVNASDYLVMPISSQCELSELTYLNYQLLFANKPNHKAIVSVVSPNFEQLSIVDTDTRQISLQQHQDMAFSIFIEFVYQGIYHIVIGLDHLLFVLVLLLGVCFNKINGKWHMETSKSTVLGRSVGILSIFTLAHSITLTGMAMGWIPQLGAWIEVVIALSIIVTALNNLYPLIRSNHALVFGFGLIHGMGFAGALGELGVSSQAKILSVLAFNLGVELGQIMFVMLVLPLLIAVKKYEYYKGIVMPLFSSLAAIVASFWLLARI